MEVFLLLGVIWAAVLVPQWLENRRDARPTASIASFNQRLWSLERMTPTYDDSAYVSTYGVAPLAPGRRARAARGRAAGPGRSVPARSGRVDGRFDGRFEGRVDGEFHGWVDGFGNGRLEGSRDEEPVNGTVVNQVPVNQVPVNGTLVDEEPVNQVPVDGVMVFNDLRDGGEVLAHAGGRTATRESANAPVTPLDVARSRTRDLGPAGWPTGRRRAGGSFDGAGAPPGAHPGSSPAGSAEALSSAAGRARRQAALMRRRRILSTLLVLALATAAVATPLGQPWWLVHGIADGLAVVYVALLVRRRRRLAEQARKVHHLSAIRAPRSGVVVLHDTGTGH